MKSKEEAFELINKAFDDSVTRTGFKKRVRNVIDKIYDGDSIQTNTIQTINEENNGQQRN